MLQQHPAANSLFLFRTNDPSVLKILVNRGEYKASASQQLAQVFVAGIGKLGHVVIAMDDQNQRERPIAPRIPDASIERQFVESNTPLAMS